MTKRWTTMTTPIGELTVLANPEGVCGVFMEEHRHRPAEDPDAQYDPGALAPIVAQLHEYFTGARRAFDVPVAFETGTVFQRRVWAALRTVPFGRTTSYGRVAAQLGAPGAARAVGLANGRNPVSVIVPCHRVVGASGSLTGYGGGVERKRWLLEHESGGTQEPLG